ncbi:MAG: valine--tRNA ligase [Flavobacteriales bacterium]|nr:valine--tRNA ligase [Flavobacteriales bacterium]
MQEIPTKYDPTTTEDKWYAYWMENELFKSVPDEREPYTIVIPPPNVTGVLHMGHMLNNTIQDVLIRRARMRGYNTCWVPGTDHASIATEAKVVRKLREEGIKKSDLSREGFLEHAWEWTHKHGGIILDQLKKLGASCDWDRTRFTMDEKYYESVIDTFIDLFEKGKIYRGERMINWDPAALTALSDEEVIYKEVNSKLYHVRYQVAGSDEWLTIATTRPETILGDTAICIHPDDERYTHLHGKRAIVPIVNREIPIILDDYVDMEFGTGCLKVTPAHDVNDYDLGEKHGLETINIMNANGTLSEEATVYVGMDRFDVRKQISADLKEKGHLVKEEEYMNKVGFSERTDVVIEPRLSLQWWLDMKELSKPALENVENDTIRFFPPKFKNSYRNWMENIKDWCISRQLWWGHQIPAYYYGEGDNDFVVAKTPEEALTKAQEKSGNASMTAADLKQDEDVMDTWFSSWLWPISVFDGFYTKEEVDYYYPTNDLVTAPEIMFFWVARMIIAGYEYRNEFPFRNVYYTGIVRDKLGRKMSKSLGNSPDPIDLMKEYGADGVRVGMLLTSPAGNDLPFDAKLCEQGRNFSNKIWNAFRLVKGWEVADIEQPEAAKCGIEWMDARLAKAISEINDLYDRFKISEALMATYRLIWDDFCSWYLEMVKPIYGSPIDRTTIEATTKYFETVLRLLHPFMPFISEEIWQLLNERKDASESICLATWPEAGAQNEGLLKDFEATQEVVASVRNIRKDKQIPNKNPLQLSVKLNEGYNKDFDAVVAHLCNVEAVDYVSEKVDQAFSFMVATNEFFVPFGETVDLEAEKEKLQKELDYQKGFLISVSKKLSNERFVNNAPEAVVASERKKQADAESKIQAIEEKLASLN